MNYHRGVIWVLNLMSNRNGRSSSYRAGHYTCPIVNADNPNAINNLTFLTFLHLNIVSPLFFHM